MQLPLLPQLPSIFQRDPTPTLAGESDGNYSYYPNYRLFFKETPSPLCVYSMRWYTIWVSIPIKSHVLSLFLAFITLSDIYYPHHTPYEGCTFRRQKKSHFIHTGWSLLLMLSMITRGRVGRDMCCNFLNSYGSNCIYIHLNCKNLVFSSC